MIPLQTLSQYAEVLGTNTHLKELHMANVRLTDKIAKVIVISFIHARLFLKYSSLSCSCMLMYVVCFLQKMGEALKDNSTLRLLNIESNFVSGEGIVAILEGINEHKCVEEFRVTNQVI